MMMATWWYLAILLRQCLQTPATVDNSACVKLKLRKEFDVSAGFQNLTLDKVLKLKLGGVLEAKVLLAF